MRLTRFNNLTKEYEYHLNNPNTSMVQDEIAGTQKLGQLEDIEDELGIDLIKLIECIRNEKGIWKKDFDGGLINTRCMLACYFGRWQIYDKENIYDLKDYGKTWALTKDELL